MSAYAVPIDIVQAALHRVAEESISSMDEGSAAALVATSNYEGIVRRQLTRHAWSFATEVVDLTLQGVVAYDPFVRAYVWPANVLNIRWIERNGVKLRSGESRLLANRVLMQSEDDYQAVVTVRAPESDWPDDFAEAMVVRMQALFLESLCDKPQDGRLLKRDAELEFRQCIVRDKRQSPPEPAGPVNRLAEVWRGGRSFRG